jgi:RNA polymerase sigma-70 factor (sigma-E family)
VIRPRAPALRLWSLHAGRAGEVQKVAPTFGATPSVPVVREVAVDDEFAEWTAGAQRRLLRSAYLLTGDLHRAEDLVQEALIKVALRWSRLRRQNPAAYARAVIVRDNVSWWRRRKDFPTATFDELAEVSSDPDAALVVQRALGRLTAKQRAVLVLRHFDDLSEAETAAALGVSIGTVKSQNAAALARLRDGAPELLDLIGRMR